MGAQVGAWDPCLKSLDGLAYSNSGRNLKTWSNFEDFIEGVYSAYSAGIWDGVANGAGASAFDNIGTALRPGIIQLTTGTTAAGRAGIFVGRSSLAPFLLGGGIYTIEADVYITTLSAVAEEYALYFGFGDTLTGDQVDGAYFRYNRLTNVNWLACTADNSARTATDTGVAVAAGAWIRLKIVVNAAGTSVAFYINNVLVATNALNIPTGAGRWTAALFNVVKSAGLTARLFDIDWAWLHFDLAVSR